MNEQDKRVKISLDSKSIIRTILIVFVAIISVAFIKAISHVLVLIFFSFFLALALNPAVGWIAKHLKSGSRVRATGIAYLLVLIFLGTFLFLVIPPLVKQTVDFIKDVPQAIQEFTAEDSGLNNFIERNNLRDQVNNFTEGFNEKFKDIGEPVLNTAGAVATAVVSTVTVLVLTFMMLIEGPTWFEKIIAIQPKDKRGPRRELAKKLYRVVTNYVNGQVIVSFIAGSFALVGLLIASNIFNVSINAVALSVIVMLFGLLPLIGATIGAVIVVLACLLVSLPLAISMAIYFIVYQQIENLTIQPYIQSKTNALTPLIVFIAALVGANLGGILGAFVAIPVAGCIKILLEEYYLSRLKKVS